MPHETHWNNGARIPSVTQIQALISKPFLDKWRESLCQCPRHKNTEPFNCGHYNGKLVAEEASTLGNLVHEEVASYLTNPDIPLQETIQPWSNEIIEKVQELGIKKYLIEPETSIVDRESNLAGSPDFVGSDGTKAFIGDLKIKNSLDLMTGIQGAGYRYLIRRTYKVDISTMLVVWAQKKTKGMLVRDVWIDLNEWEQAWMSVVTLWNYQNPSRKVLLRVE